MRKQCTLKKQINMSGWKINGCFKESLILGLIENGQSLLGHDKNEHVTFKLGP